jgi:hypothetical protein
MTGVHAEARTQVTEARKSYLCRWATSLGALCIYIVFIVEWYWNQVGNDFLSNINANNLIQ